MGNLRLRSLNEYQLADFVQEQLEECDRPTPRYKHMAYQC